MRWLLVIVFVLVAVAHRLDARAQQQISLGSSEGLVIRTDVQPRLSPGVIGNITATNSPTGWSIVSVNPSGHTSYYSIANVSGQGQLSLTSAGATGLTGQTGTDIVTVQASNAYGSGSGTATINYAPAGNIMPAYNNLTTNWANAGLAKIGGIPTRNTECGATVTPSGLVPPQANDDAAKINAAITACTAGQVVQLSAGTFQLDISESVQINKAVTLRGMGNCTNGNSPYCSTVIQHYNGAWPLYSNATQCGSTTATPPGSAPSTSGCPFGSDALILLAPPGGYHTNNLGWGSNGGNCQMNNSDPTAVGCGTLLAADVAQGATTVQVASTANFSVGMWVLIDEAPTLQSTTNPLAGQANLSATPEFLNSSGTPVTNRMSNPDMNCSYSMCTARLNSELHLVSAIGRGPCPGANCTLTFDAPLTMAFRQSGSHDGRVYWPTQYAANVSVPFLQQAGVENLTVSRSIAVGPIGFVFCAYCWAKNVETSYWINGVMIHYAARVQVTHSYLHDCVDCQNDGAEYPISIEAGSTEVLVDDNIIVLGGKGMVGRAGHAAVVAYNYVDKTFYQQASIGDWWQDLGLNGSHEAGTHHWLMEGNWADNCDGDETHGNAQYHTFFRNDCTGVRSVFTDPSCAFYACANGSTVNDASGTCNNGVLQGGGTSPCSRLRAAGPMAHNYWYAFIANVLGLAGTTTAANGWVYSSTANPPPNKAIWASGWTGSEWNYQSDPHLNEVIDFWIFKNGNFDYVNNSVVDNASGYSQAFPDSLYLSSKPAFFTGGSCTYPWPWVTPKSSPPIQQNSCSGSGLPALARYNAGTPFVQP